MAVLGWGSNVEGRFKVDATLVEAYITFTKWFGEHLLPSKIIMIEYGTAAAWPQCNLNSGKGAGH